MAFRSLSVCCLMMGLSAAAWAGTPLSGEQIRQLVSGNTVDAQAKSGDVKVYYGLDGSSLTRAESNGRITKGFWRISEAGEICSLRPPGKESCGPVVNNGDGTYHRMDGNTVRGVWTKVHPGKIISE